MLTELILKVRNKMCKRKRMCYVAKLTRKAWINKNGKKAWNKYNNESSFENKPTV